MRTDDTEGVVAVGRLLITAIGHGLRTPLHSLLGFLELLSTTELDEDGRNLVRDARDSGEELLTASDRLIMLLRLLADEAPDLPQPFSPGDLLREIAMSFPPDQPVVVDSSPYLPDVLHGDVRAVRLLLGELAGNAARHGARHTLVYAERVTAFNVSPVRVRFTVTDDGPGLPEPVLRQLTGADDLHVEVQHVGIFLARRLARQLGTTLTIIRSDDRGTSIMFEPSFGTDGLPETAVPGTPALVAPAIVEPAAPGVSALASAVLDPAALASAAHGSAASVSTSPVSTSPVSAAPVSAALASAALSEPVERSLHVLLVEDNSVNRILAQRQMARLGHKLDVVTDGTAGVEAVLTGSYDVVLMDRHLPDIDGIESTRRIREAESSRVPARHTPIIAVTADASPGHRQECQRAGMDGFLTKPLDLEHLRTAIIAVTTEQSSGDPALPTLPGLTVQAAALDRLRESLDGDEHAVTDVVRTYLEELATRRMRVDAALRRAEARQAAAAAETLWTSSQTVGAVHVAELCERIHHAARTGDLEQGRALLPELRTVCDRTAAALAEAVAA